jgi:hypothetical protein
VFVGVVLFSRGANNNMLRPFGLLPPEGCELVRVALRSHVSPVSRIVAIAIRLLRKKCPGLRLIVSFADPGHDHVGTIYQAGNWVFTGQRPPTIEYLAPDGKQWHGRMVSANGRTRVYGVTRSVWRHDQCKPIECEGKYRYLMPLDDAMRKQIEPLRRPYPKRAESIDSDVPALQAGEGGAIPTSALQVRPEGV